MSCLFGEKMGERNSFIPYSTQDLEFVQSENIIPYEWKCDIEISTIQSCNRLIVDVVNQIGVIRPHRLKDTMYQYSKMILKFD